MHVCKYIERIVELQGVLRDDFLGLGTEYPFPPLSPILDQPLSSLSPPSISLASLSLSLFLCVYTHKLYVYIRPPSLSLLSAESKTPQTLCILWLFTSPNYMPFTIWSCAETSNFYLEHFFK